VRRASIGAGSSGFAFVCRQLQHRCAAAESCPVTHGTSNSPASSSLSGRLPPSSPSPLGLRCRGVWCSALRLSPSAVDAGPCAAGLGRCASVQAVEAPYTTASCRGVSCACREFKSKPRRRAHWKGAGAPGAGQWTRCTSVPAVMECAADPNAHGESHTTAGLLGSTFIPAALRWGRHEPPAAAAIAATMDSTEYAAG